MPRTLKHYILALSLLVGFLVALPQMAGAVDVLQPVCHSTPGGTPTVCQDNQAAATESPLVGPTGILTRAFNLISLFVGIVAVFVMTLAGLRMIIAQGDPEAFARARQAILFAILGLVLAAVAQVLIRFVLYKL